MSDFSHGELFPDSLESARVIVPVVVEVLGLPNRVVDLGGGTGAWARAFREAGAESAVCIDDPRMKSSELHVEAADFVPHDLSSSMPKPVECDLAVSLEVAEHLPSALTDELVAFLTGSAPVVLFSASRPGQPGYGHINEQPARFWRERFAAANYSELDLIRPRIVGQSAIPYWYRQNLMVYASEPAATRLASEAVPFDAIPEDFELVSERLLEIYRRPPAAPKLGWLLREIPRAAIRSVKARTRR